MKSSLSENIIALAGNPNVGKSTLFNALTGMKQHTGNWPGKTVGLAHGKVSTAEKEYLFVDIPGTYSLSPHSAEEEVAGAFLCFEKYDAAVVVCDATCLERNLNLTLQIMEIAPKTIVCVNLLDEAKRKNIQIDLKLLSEQLGVAVVGTVARSKKSIKELMRVLDELSPKEKTLDFKMKYPKEIETASEILQPVLQEKIGEKLKSRWVALKLLEGNTPIISQINEFLGYDILQDFAVSKTLDSANEYLSEKGISKQTAAEMIGNTFVLTAQNIAQGAVRADKGYNLKDRKIDRILTSKKFGYPIMLALLGMIFWITVFGANYCSNALSYLFLCAEKGLNLTLLRLSSPEWLRLFIIEGIFRVPSWVVSVMLPPMAIFFPLFTLLEDSGYLPRVAYNLDKPFNCCGGCGKQALTTCMGFGCNAVGVTGCRIIDSKRERMLAIITNSFVPCNGRFPMIIAVITMFFVTLDGVAGSLLSAVLLTVVILFSLFLTFVATKILSRTVLKGSPSSYILEMPSYRKPQFASVIFRSVFDRTLFVLGRSLAVAVPAGIIIFIMANATAGGESLLILVSKSLDPLGKFIGLDGAILLAFILGFPANEIVIPIALMIYSSGNSLIEITSLTAIREILTANGWSAVTAACVIVFSLLHWPCSTTVLTIKKETGSIKWALFSIIYPTAFGIMICAVISFISKLFV